MGGQAIEIADRIPAERFNHNQEQILDEIRTILDIDKDSLKPIGSVGKKKDSDSYGDLDLLLDKHHCTLNNAYSILKEKGYYVKKVGTIITFAFPLGDIYAQVDIMPTHNMTYGRFLYHSPNFRNDESKYSGAHRNILLFNIVKNVKNIVLNVFEPGVTREFKKPALTPYGLMEQERTYRSKDNKVLKHPQKVKERKISEDPLEIVQYILGPDAQVKDANSFESLLEYIKSDQFIAPEVVSDILNNVTEGIKNAKMSIPDELTEYEDV